VVYYNAPYEVGALLGDKIVGAKKILTVSNLVLFVLKTNTHSAVSGRL